jgi:hypothetical protein
MERPSDTPDERRTGHHAHTRYTIIRTAERGVRILRREDFGIPSDAPPVRAADLPQPAVGAHRTAGQQSRA